MIIVQYTVRLLSFMAGIMKSICVKEMTLLWFSFQHRSLVTVHTDLQGHTASGCLCRSRPLQWCLMYLSRLSGCPKSSFAMVFNVLVTAVWMSEIESKRRPYKWDFTFGNKKQSAVAKSGDYGGWSSTVTFRWVKNCLTIVALWDGA